MKAGGFLCQVLNCDVLLSGKYVLCKKIGSHRASQLQIIASLTLFSLPESFPLYPSVIESWVGV
jgi:hypothetical protein